MRPHRLLPRGQIQIPQLGRPGRIQRNNHPFYNMMCPRGELAYLAMI